MRGEENDVPRCLLERVRLLMIGYFEGLDSERGIAWRARRLAGPRQFLRIGLNEQTPNFDHRTRRLIDVESALQSVPFWVLGVLADAGLVKPTRATTTLEANAAMRLIVRADNGASYDEFTGLAQTLHRDARIGASGSQAQEERFEPGMGEPVGSGCAHHEMKDGTTHLVYKAEHAVDMESGAVIAVTLQPATRAIPSSGKPWPRRARRFRELIEREATAASVSQTAGQSPRH